jgi:hypothetical protein
LTYYVSHLTHSCGISSALGSATSEQFQFTYRPGASSVKFLSMGDMGIKNSHGTSTMCNADAATGQYDLTVNVGDTSYADDYKKGANAYVFDEHFRNIEVYSAACCCYFSRSTVHDRL